MPFPSRLAMYSRFVFAFPHLPPFPPANANRERIECGDGSRL